MLRLVLAFVDIALHRRGPEQLPASTFLLAFAFVVYVLVAYVTIGVNPSVERPALFLAFGVVLYAGFVWSVLKAFNRERRFRQTATALLGTDTLFNLMSLPLIWWNRDAASDAPLTLLGVLQYVVVFWSIDVSGYVLSKAIGRPYIVGVSLVVAYVLLSISMRASFFPTSS